MNEQPHHLKLIKGNLPKSNADLAEVAKLVELPFEEALPLLRQIARARKAAANSVHAVVEPGTLEDPV